MFYRRSLIQAFCASHAHGPSDTTLLAKVTHNITHWEEFLWNSVKYRFSYCSVPKVGGTTWSGHMISVHGRKYHSLK